MISFVHHLAYDFRTGIRDRSKLLMFYLFPIVFFFLVGGLMSSLNPGFKTTMIPGMILFAFMCSALLNLPGIFVNAREAGVFRSYRINGVPSASIISVPVISTAFHMAVVAVAICLAGVSLFDGVGPASLGFIVAALLCYASYAGIGVLIGVASGNATISILAAQIVYIPSIMLGGFMVPSAMLPPGLQRIALLLPASHAMSAFMGIGMPGSGPTPWISIVVLAASACLSFALAAWLFEWDARASAPSRKAWAALLAIAPFGVSALIGA